MDPHLNLLELIIIRLGQSQAFRKRRQESHQRQLMELNGLTSSLVIIDLLLRFCITDIKISVQMGLDIR